MCVVYAKVVKTMSDKYFVIILDGKKTWIPKLEIIKKVNAPIDGYYAFTISKEFAVKKNLTNYNAS